MEALLSPEEIAFNNGWVKSPVTGRWIKDISPKTTTNAAGWQLVWPNN